jgi:hypothetical protein
VRLRLRPNNTLYRRDAETQRRIQGDISSRSAFSAAGFVSLFGVAVMCGVLSITEIKRRRQGGLALRDAVVAGSRHDAGGIRDGESAKALFSQELETKQAEN